MFTDTHFHLSYFNNQDMNSTNLLIDLIKEEFPIVIDSGTRADDLPGRLKIADNFISSINEESLRYIRQKNSDANEEFIKDKIHSMLQFTAGIWPDVSAIKERESQIITLENNVKKYRDRICAIGECGLDHHWNPSGADNRDENSFSDEIFDGEKELFEMQLNLAKKNNLPVVVHTRDAFEQTVNCIKNVGYNNGEIHCFSYGIEEARTFLDLGWYIALGGAVTYSKKSKIEEMEKLIRFIPDDRLLLETDAPYLAPVPCRGKPNSPLLIHHTYEFIAKVRNCELFELATLVKDNAKRLFFF